MAVKKILIVDDSPTDRQFSWKPCQTRYQVVTAENGDEAITKSKSEKTRSHPHGRGHAGHQWLSGDACDYARRGDQAHTGDCRHQARTRKPIAVWGMRQGAKDYLMKPIDAKDLLAKIAAIK